jgi:hypothetical protein
LKELHAGIQDLKSKGLAVESISPMGALYLTIKLDYLGKPLQRKSDREFYRFGFLSD